MKREYVFALYFKERQIDEAFGRLEELYLSSYSRDAGYALIIEPQPSEAFRGKDDLTLEDRLKRGYEILTKRYSRRFFVALRARKYNAFAFRKGLFRYACVGGFEEAARELIDYKNNEIPAPYSVSFGDALPSGKFVFADMTSKSKGQCFRVNGFSDAFKIKYISSRKTAVICCIEKIGKYFTRSDCLFATEPSFDYIREIAPEAKFRLKTAVLASSHSFFDVFDGKIEPPHNLRDLSLAICAVAALQMFSVFGDAEAEELYLKFLIKLDNVTSFSSDGDIDGDDILLLTVASEAMRANVSPARFSLLRQKLVNTKIILSQRALSKGVNGLSMSICAKETPFSARFERNFGVLGLVFGSDTLDEFWEFISGRMGSGDIAVDSEIIIRASQIYFRVPFRKLVMENREVYARRSLINPPFKFDRSKSIAAYGRESAFIYVRRAREVVLSSPKAAEMRKHLAEVGVSSDRIIHAMFLDRVFVGGRQKCIIAFDSLNELVQALAEAAPAATGEILFICKNPEVRGELKRLCPRVNVTAYTPFNPSKTDTLFCQLTPFSTLSSIMRDKALRN